jgi:uncharacterized low-complexity protein
MNSRKTNISIALATALGASSGAALADNPFGLKAMSGGYQLADSHGKSAEAKCGGKMKTEEKSEEKSSDGSCGGKKKTEEKSADGSCGGNKKAAEGACGGKK